MAGQVIETHPQRTDIINDLIEGLGVRTIAKRYGVSKSSLQRYLADNLPVRAAEYQAERNLKTGEDILRKIENVMERVQLMYDACDAYLRDPDDPDVYFLGPRADELEVAYTEWDADGKMQRAKAGLQELINGSVPGEVSRISYKHQDPRKLLLDTAQVLNRQLELLARIQGQVADVNINLMQQPVFIQLQKIIIEATSTHPEVRRIIADRIQELGRDE